MKDNKIEKITAFSIIISLILIMIYVIINYSCNLVKKDTKTAIKVNWTELYPFENKSNIQITNNTNILHKYNEKINKTKKILEEATSTSLPKYENFIELSYIYNNIIFYDLVSNSNNKIRIKLQDGYFSRIQEKKDVSYISKNLIDFNNYLNNLGIELLYVQAPSKISEVQKIPSIYKDYTNENINNLLENLNGNVNYLDLRENIKKENLNHLELFFKTDHHWLPQTGLWATKTISTHLNNNYNLKLTLENIEPSRYEYTTYEKMFLGSDGKYVTLKNSNPENFVMITPKFKTKLNVKIPDMGITKTDSFENTLINWNALSYENYYKIDQYTSYLYGGKPLIEIHNELVNNNKKILLIKDSFSEVIAPFMALENEYLSIIDLRYFDGSIKNYITQFNPNIVLVIYNPSVLIDINKVDNSENIVYLWDFE